MEGEREGGGEGGGKKRNIGGGMMRRGEVGEGGVVGGVVSV